MAKFSYKIVFRRSAQKELRELPRQEVERIMQKISHLANNPRPVGSIKLSQQEKHRIRQGNYRILYSIDEATKIVTIVKIAHRKHVYNS